MSNIEHPSARGPELTTPNDAVLGKGVKPVFIGIIQGYEDTPHTLMDRQTAAINSLLRNDVTGHGRVALFIDNPISSVMGYEYE